MDRLLVKGFRAKTRIGVHAWEQQLSQDVVLDLTLTTPVAAPAQGDDLAQALDYDALTRALTAFLETSHHQLIETLAERVAAFIQQEFSVPWLQLDLTKPGALACAQSVTISIQRGSNFD